MDLVADILDGDPFRGIGKPEPLKYIASDTWSRRIDLENRLVYKVKGDYAPRSLRIAFIFYKLVTTIKKRINSLLITYFFSPQQRLSPSSLPCASAPHRNKNHKPTWYWGKLP